MCVNNKGVYIITTIDITFEGSKQDFPTFSIPVFSLV